MKSLTAFALCTGFALVSFSIARAADHDAFTLNGDQLGDSFSAYLSRHPTAQCVDATKTRKLCYEWSDISIFGMAAQPQPQCSPKSAGLSACAEGRTAQFEKESLISLTYAVRGTDKAQAVATLTKSFGSPVIDTPGGTIWSQDGETASVTVGKADPSGTGPTLVTFLIAATN